MTQKRRKIIPYIFLCGIGALNLFFMSLEFFKTAGVSLNAYNLVLRWDGLMIGMISFFQTMAMLLSFGMLTYGAMGVLYTLGIISINMHNKNFSLFCTLFVLAITLLYSLQFFFVIAVAAREEWLVGAGVYLSVFFSWAIMILFLFVVNDKRMYSGADGGLSDSLRPDHMRPQYPPLNNGYVATPVTQPQKPSSDDEE